MRRTARPVVMAVAAGVFACDASATRVPRQARVPVVVPCPAPAPAPDGLPIVHVGYDAYRAWDRWPDLRIGTRTYLTSTHDRSGRNTHADAGSFLRLDQEPSAQLVALDVAGPGVLWFVRTNRWHGSPWHYVVDGVDTTVEETNTAHPDQPTPDATFLPSELFPEPLALTWPTTHGSDLSWVPIPFASALSLRYERAFYATGYFIHSAFPEGATNLSQAPCTWERTAPPEDVRALLRTTAEDMAPSLGTTRADGDVDVPAEGAVLVQRIEGGPTTLRALALEVGIDAAPALGRAWLQITWDDRALPSVYAPIALFFGTGSMWNRDRREHLVRSFATTVHETAGRVRLTTIFPMPFARSATIAIVGAGEPIPSVSWTTRTEPQARPPNTVGYFHATHRDVPVPTRGRDNVLLDTRTDEGGGDWCGTFVGTSFVFSRRADLRTLEGDPRFFFDDAETPQAQGTGTEEWAGGGDYWGGRTTTLPLAGHPVGAPSREAATSPEDEVQSAYRWLLADAMPFGRNARIQLEHGGLNDADEHSTTIAYWYGLPGACLVPADTLKVGDVADEQRHGWSARGASEPTTVTSRWDTGLEQFATTEIQRESTDTGRTITDQSTFRLAIPPDNEGVLLRRKLDQAVADQRAEVYIADDRPDAPFVRAGTWFTAGGATSVFVAANTETGYAEPSTRTSNRRWRDDELLIARGLTHGRDAIRVRIDVVGSRPWSEVRYDAYAWRLPPPP